jgi:hypothetical protein
MAVSLAQLRGMHSEALEKVRARLADLDAQRPALCLDGDPADVAELDEGRLRLQLEADRHEAALEEVGRREEAEAATQAEVERTGYRTQLAAVLTGREKHVKAAVKLADELGDVLGSIIFDDERLAFELARKLGLQDLLRSTVPPLSQAIIGRLQALKGSLPYVSERDMSRADEHLRQVVGLKAEAD